MSLKKVLFIIGIVVLGAGAAFGAHWYLSQSPETNDGETVTDDSGSTNLTEDSSQLPTIYITIASHQQGSTSTNFVDYANDEDAFWAEREGVVNFANMVHEEGAKYSFQSEFTFLQALVKYDKGTESTNGKNLIRYLTEDLGFEVDTNFHGDTYNEADGAYLFEQLGVPPSHTVGGLIASPAEDSKIEYYRNELHGLQYDATWKAEILWGAATLYHQGDEEVLWASGIWKPQDNENFLVNDENAPLPYVGLYMHGWEGVNDLIAKQQAGELEPGKIYTVTIFTGDMKKSSTIQQFRSQLEELSDARERGEVQFVGIKEVVDIWKTQYNSEPNIYVYTEHQDTSTEAPVEDTGCGDGVCGAVEEKTGACPEDCEETTKQTSPDLGAVDSSAPDSVKIVFAANFEEGESCHRDGATGCDLYSVEYDLQNHEVKGVERLTTETNGPEWFADIDPQGENIAYESIVESSTGKTTNTIVWMNLETGKSGVLVEGGRFPDISADGAYLVYGDAVSKNVKMALLMQEKGLQAGNPGALTDEAISEDPSISPDNTLVIYHFHETGSSARTKVLNIATGETIDFTGTIGCGHATFNLDGSTGVCVLPKGDAIKARDYKNGEWGELYDLTPTYTTDDFAEFDARYKECNDVVLSYPAFCASNDYLLVGAQCLTAPGSDGRSETTFSELFLLKLGATADATEMIPLHAQMEEFLGVEGKDSVTGACR